MDPWDNNKNKPGGNPLDTAEANVNKIRQYVKHMKGLAQEFGSDSDTQELRDRMHEGRRVTAGVGKETANLLKTSTSDKVRQDKLKRALQQALEEFERMSREHQQMEREILVKMEEQYSATYGTAPDLGSYQDEPEVRKRGRTKLQLELADGMEDADVKIIQERNREVQRIDEELEEVVDLFQEVNEMVDVQGEKLDVADQRIEMAETTVREVEEELSLFYRCCGCCCVKRGNKRREKKSSN